MSFKLNDLVQIIKSNLTIVKNFGYLNLVQILNYGFPLVVMPYLVLRLGLSNYGLVNYAIAISSYFLLFIDFGFSLQGTKEVQNNKNDLNKLNEINSSIYIIKLFISLFCLIIMCLLILVFSKLGAEKWLYIYTLLSVVFQSMIPVWLFQGLEKMQFNAILTFLSKGIFLVFLFSFDIEKTDYILVPLGSLLGWFITFIISLVITYKKFKIKFIIPSYKIISQYISRSYPLFISQFSINFFRNMNTIILGVFSSDFVIGIYTLSEKIVKSVQSLQNPLGQALFPFLTSKWSKQSPLKSLKSLIRFSKYPLLFFVFLYIATLLSSGFIITYFAGKFDLRIFINLMILLPVVIIGGMNYYFGILGLVAIGLNDIFKKSVFIASSTGFIFMLFLNYLFNDIGASIAFLLTELILLYKILSYIKMRIQNEE